MKALILKEKGTPPSVGEHPDFQVQEGEARVKVHAAALNHRDVWIMHGMYPGIVYPIVLGSDGSGVVEEVKGGDQSWVGKEVVINPSLDWGENPRYQRDDFSILGLPRHGTLAEEIAIPVENLAEKPAHLSHAEAAALPLAGLTAWRALMTRGELREGERVLISGVGGGVALFAMQFAVAAGAEVVVTSSSPSKIERAIEMGAKAGVGYGEEGWNKELFDHAPEGFDVIIDSAGGEGFGDLARALGPGGRLVFYGGTRGRWPKILPQHLFYKQVSILASTMGSPEEFKEMIAFVNEHQIKPVVDRVFPLETGGDAFTYLDSGVQLGKVVVET